MGGEVIFPKAAPLFMDLSMDNEKERPSSTWPHRRWRQAEVAAAKKAKVRGKPGPKPGFKRKPGGRKPGPKPGPKPGRPKKNAAVEAVVEAS
jgi:hypothetical protein